MTSLTERATLAWSQTTTSPAGQVTAERVPRCQLLVIHPRRGTNRCSDEAVDANGEVLVCQRHLALILELAGRLPGIQIELTGVPA